MSGCLTRTPNAPRAQQAEQRLLLWIEVQIPRADYAQMARAEIVNGSAVEILLDDRRAHIGRARDRRRVPEALADLAHHHRHGSFLLGRTLCRLCLGKLDRGDERAAPGAEILGRELLPHVLLDVLVQRARAEVEELAVSAIPEQPAATLQGEQLLHRGCELGIDKHRAADHAVLRPEAEADLAPAHADVALPQGGDPEGLVAPRIALAAHAKPALVDEPHRERGRPFGAERLLVEVLAERLPKLRKTLSKAHELVVFRLLLARAEFRVVEVLPPARSIDAGRLQLRARPRRDPDVLPRGRDAERVDPLQRDLVRDRAAARVLVPEPTALRTFAPPSPLSRHRVCGVADSAKS